MYKCIKRAFFPSLNDEVRAGEFIDKKKYSQLSTREKEYFTLFTLQDYKIINTPLYANVQMC
jgi:hypothetical protein